MNSGGEQRGVFDVDEDRALDALALAWGDAYEIYVVDGQWQAWREGPTRRRSPRAAGWKAFAAWAKGRARGTHHGRSA